MEWADVHDIVTAIAYQPNGEVCVNLFDFKITMMLISQLSNLTDYLLTSIKQGFIVGCISGTCRFYELKGV